MKKHPKLTKSAKGEDCQVRIPGICNFNPETTIPAHLGGAGMGTKHHDMMIAYCCSNCHSAVDGGVSYHPSYSYSELKLMHLEGIVRTQYILLEKGLINVK